MKINLYLHSLLRGFSSAGSEHLPYKQRVGGSNPSTPTTRRGCLKRATSLFLADVSDLRGCFRPAWIRIAKKPGTNPAFF
jgi:hypothetical protein